MGKPIRNGKTPLSKSEEFGTKVNGRRFGWFKKRRGELLISTKYDDGYPVIEKRFLSGELISTTYFKKVKKKLDN